MSDLERVGEALGKMGFVRLPGHQEDGLEEWLNVELKRLIGMDHEWFFVHMIEPNPDAENFILTVEHNGVKYGIDELPIAECKLEEALTVMAKHGQA